MVKASLQTAIEKLATAGERAGFTIEQMIQLLGMGLSVEALIDLIIWRLESVHQPLSAVASLSTWIA